MRYASFVRHLGANKCSHTWNISANVWTTICSLRPTQILFPHLRSIIWYTPWQLLPGESLPSLLACVGTGLVKLDLGNHVYWPADRRTLANFSIITERFPALQVFSIGEEVDTLVSYDPPADLGVVVSALACGFTSLVSFSSIDIPLTPIAILSLLQAKTLRCLNVHLPDDMTPLSERLAPHRLHNAPVTLQLEKVGLFSTTQAYVEFSKVIALPHATRFKLSLTDVMPSHLIPTVFNSIRRQCSPAALTTLSVSDAGGDGDILRTGEQLRPTHLRPLLELQRLEFLHVELWFRYALDDSFCAEMARAWPCMQYLYVWCDLPGEVLPSVRALPPFATYCPKLKHLGLVFDAMRWDNESAFNADHANAEIYGALADKASTSALSALSPRPSPMCGPQYMAAFLARVFPNLEKIDGAPRAVVNGVIWENRWEEVEPLLRLLKSAMQDERLRMAQELAEGAVET